ncbi:WD domain, G-beta repeat protein, partial [Opisthorchis viverrini]
MSSVDRKQELERKKAKLAALREQKSRKTDVLTNGSYNHGTSGNDVGGNSVRIDTDELLKTLGISIPESSPNATRDHVPQSKMMPFDDSTAVDIDPSVLVTGKRRLSSTAGDLPAKTPTEFGVDFSEPVKIRTLTEEDRMNVMRSEDFCAFFDRAARLIERALDESNIFLDYGGVEHDDATSDGDTRRRQIWCCVGQKRVFSSHGPLHLSIFLAHFVILSASQRHQLLRFGRDFYDDRWSRRRCVTALDWSPSYPELLLGSYFSNEDAPHEPDGVCLIWNLKFQKTTPEYIFHCQSPVTSATLALFHPNLVIGGTYSGQIVIWDNRCTKRTPVQRTMLSATAHTHPVHAVKVVGTQNAHNLISVSSDGKLCSWSLDMLSQPQQSMELTYRQTRPVSATSMSFFHEDVNNFLVGSEDGRVYTGSRHGRVPYQCLNPS